MRGFCYHYHMSIKIDTLAAHRQKTTVFEREIEEWHDVITKTD